MHREQLWTRAAVALVCLLHSTSGPTLAACPEIPGWPTPPARTSSAKRIYPSAPIQLGTGYSTIAELERGVATRAKSVIEREELAINYDLTLLESYRDLAKTLGVSVSAAYNSLAGSVEGRASFFRSSRVSSRSVYMLVRMTVSTGYEQLVVQDLEPVAEEMLAKPAGRDAFISSYGDSFVHRIGYGGELLALLEFREKEGQSTESIRAELSAKLNAFSGNASLEQSLREITKDREVKISYSQSGGGTGRKVTPQEGTAPAKGGVLSMTPAELELRVRDFPTEVVEQRKTARILWADVIDYSIVSASARELSTCNEALRSWVLDDADALLGDLFQVRDTWADAIWYGGDGSVRESTAVTGTAVPPTNDDLVCLDEKIKDIERQVKLLASNPTSTEDVVKKLGGWEVIRSRDLRTYVLRGQGAEGVTGAALARTSEEGKELTPVAADCCGLSPTSITGEWLKCVVGRQLPVVPKYPMKVTERHGILCAGRGGSALRACLLAPGLIRTPPGNEVSRFLMRVPSDAKSLEGSLVEFSGDTCHGGRARASILIDGVEKWSQDVVDIRQPISFNLGLPGGARQVELRVDGVDGGWCDDPEWRDVRFTKP